MLKGLTAYRLVFVRAGATAVLLLWFIALVIGILFLRPMFDSSQTLRATLIFGLAVVALVTGVVSIWQIVKREKEVKAGYTTMINWPANVDVRDPSDGRLLLRAKDRLRESPMSLKQAREFANRHYL